MCLKEALFLVILIANAHCVRGTHHSIQLKIIVFVCFFLYWKSTIRKKYKRLLFISHFHSFPRILSVQFSMSKIFIQKKRNRTLKFIQIKTHKIVLQPDTWILSGLEICNLHRNWVICVYICNVSSQSSYNESTGLIH